MKNKKPEVTPDDFYWGKTAFARDFNQVSYSKSYPSAIHQISLGTFVNEENEQKPYLAISIDRKSYAHDNDKTSLQSLALVEKMIGTDLEGIEIIHDDIEEGSESDEFGATTVYLIGDIEKVIVHLSQEMGRSSYAEDNLYNAWENADILGLDPALLEQNYG